MVKVTFEQDDRVEDVTSGDFVFAVVGSMDKREAVGYMFGETSDTATTNALMSFVKNAVGKAIDSNYQKAAYKILRATIDTEIKRLEAEESEKEETPEAATSGISGK